MTEQSVREAILVASRDLFFEKGLEGTSMREIATRVGVAQSSIYNHFPTKDALVTAVMERSFAIVDGEARKVFERPPSLAVLREALRAHALQHVHGIKETVVFELEGRHMPPAVRERVIELRGVYERRFYDLAEALAARGCLDANETRTRVRMLLSAGVDIGGWFQPGGRLDAAQVAEIYADFGLDALGARRDGCGNGTEATGG